MGVEQSLEKITYQELSNTVFNALKKDIEDEAEYILDSSNQESFVSKALEKNPKRRFSRDSRLVIDFDEQKSVYILDSVRGKMLPDLATLSLKDIGSDVKKFEVFILRNFPQEVDRLSIYNAGIDLTKMNFASVLPVSNKISKSLFLSKVRLSTKNLACLFKRLNHLEEISLQNCKLTDSDDFALKGEFKNLQRLNLENIGLTQSHIEHISNYLINESKKSKEESKENGLQLRNLKLNLYQKGLDKFLVQTQKKFQRSSSLVDFRTTEYVDNLVEEEDKESFSISKFSNTLMLRVMRIIFLGLFILVLYPIISTYH
mmetsp:Transcript_15772/g.13797  ORF Transcript_15772/g.13797 Transcript_15772/m.13797 type:complete len:316 (+) Transcript_15772:20-967(+)